MSIKSTRRVVPTISSERKSRHARQRRNSVEARAKLESIVDSRMHDINKAKKKRIKQKRRASTAMCSNYQGALGEGELRTRVGKDNELHTRTADGQWVASAEDQSKWKEGSLEWRAGKADKAFTRRMHNDKMNDDDVDFDNRLRRHRRLSMPVWGEAEKRMAVAGQRALAYKQERADMGKCCVIM